MRTTNITLRPADKARMELGVRFAEFGLPDPLGGLREKGFDVKLDGAGTGITFTFKGTMIAQSYFLNSVQFDDALPEEADARIISVIHKIAETSAKVDRLLKADKRTVEAYCQRSVYNGDAPFRISPENLFLTQAVYDEKAKITVELQGAHDPSNPHATYTVRVRSDVIYTNDDLNYNGFGYLNGEVRLGYRKISEEALLSVAEAARPLYEAAIQDITHEPMETSVELTPEFAEMWAQLKNVPVRNVGDLRVHMSAGDLVVKHSAHPEVKLLRVLRSKDDEMRVDHGGLPEGIVNALTRVAVDTLMAEPGLRPVKKADTIFDEAGRLLVDDDAGGYRIL